MSCLTWNVRDDFVDLTSSRERADVADRKLSVAEDETASSFTAL